MLSHPDRSSLQHHTLASISSLPARFCHRSLLKMPSVREILDAFRGAGTSDAAIDAIASLELSADDLLDLAPAEVWGVADDDAERIAGAIAAISGVRAEARSTLKRRWAR